MAYRILIADDAAMNRVLIKKILAQSLQDLHFEEAVDGQQVLDIVAKVQIDMIILDIIMPVLDGYETLKALKLNPLTHDIPVIVNSAITEIKSIEKTLLIGAVDYFTKPLSPNDMKILLPLKAKNALLLYEQNRTIVELNRRINEELKNANTFANIMLPKTDGFIGIDLHTKYHPSLGIGGDYFDCLQIDGRTHFVIADVTGHGIAAGMASSMVKILYRKSIDKPNIKPNEILEEMNRSIFSIFDFAGADNYLVFTAFVGIIEDGILHFANAGQPYPMLYHHDTQSFEEIRQNGFLIGMIDDVPFETLSIPIKKEDAVFLYTDGLFCSGEAGDFTGWEKVLNLGKRLRYAMEKNPDDFLNEIFYAFHMIHKANQSEFTDDVAMMLIKVTE